MDKQQLEHFIAEVDAAIAELMTNPENNPAILDYWDTESEDDLEMVQLDGKWGVINKKTGVFVIPCRWDDIYTCAEGLYYVANDGKWGVISETGTPVIPCRWDDINFLTDHLYAVLSGGKRGLIDHTGATVSPCQWDYLCLIGERLFIVGQNGKFGLLDLSGAPVTPCQWDWIDDRYNSTDIFLIAELSGKYTFFTIDGKPMTRDQLDRIFQDKSYSFWVGSKHYTVNRGDVIENPSS